MSNVPLQADKDNLKALIERYAMCEGLVIPSDGGGKVGSVYKVMMRSDDEAEKAITALHGLKLYGQKLKVRNQVAHGGRKPRI